MKNNTAQEIEVVTKELLSHYDPGVKNRGRIEMDIVTKILQQAQRDGFEVQEEGNENKPYDSIVEALSEIFAVDSINLWIGNNYWISLVMGNDGYDVICDYGTKAENWLKPINDYVESMYG